MLGTYCYTSSLVSSHRYSSLSPSPTHFPIVFAAAYKQWAAASRTFTLTETSQSCLSSALGPGQDSSLAVVVQGRQRGRAANYCRLTERGTGRSARLRLLLSEEVAGDTILATPTCLRNLAEVLRIDYAAITSARFSYRPYKREPKAAAVKVGIVHQWTETITPSFRWQLA